MSITQQADLSNLKMDKSKKTSESGSNKKIILFSLITIFAVVILVAIFFSDFFTKTIEVKTSFASLTSESESSSVLTASGYVVARRKASLSSKSMGRLIYLGVEEGDKVKSGDLIGRIESSDVEAILTQANASLEVTNANLSQAEAEAEESKNNFNRSKKLFEENLLSQAEFDAAIGRNKRAIANVISAKASIAAAKANVKFASVAVENTYIRAPFDGTVLSKNADVGEVITSMGAAIGSRGALVTLADMNSLEVEADVSESNLEKVKIDQPCEVSLDAYPTKKYAAKLFKIIPTADRAKATIKTRIQFIEKDEKVLPEMSVKILFLDESKIKNLNTDKKPKLTIPASSIFSDGGIKKVFIVDDGIVKIKNVVLGSVIDNNIEIVSGIKNGDEVVVNPPSGLKDGSKIEIKN